MVAYHTDCMCWKSHVYRHTFSIRLSRYYQRLKHMVSDKVQSRSRGPVKASEQWEIKVGSATHESQPRGLRISLNGRVRKVQTLTRQPTEGLGRLSNYFGQVEQEKWWRMQILFTLHVPRRLSKASISLRCQSSWFWWFVWSCCWSLDLSFRACFPCHEISKTLACYCYLKGSLFAQLGRSCKGRRLEIWRNGPWAANALRIRWLVPNGEKSSSPKRPKLSPNSLNIGEGRWFFNQNIWRSEYIEYIDWRWLKWVVVGVLAPTGTI